MDPSVNWLAILVATVATFGLGALWYGPLFGTTWRRQLDLSEEDLDDANMGRIFGTAFVLQLVMAINLAFFLSGSSVGKGALYGFLTGFGWIAMAIGVNYLFRRESFTLWLIDSFYFVVGLTVMGVILTAWP